MTHTHTDRHTDTLTDMSKCRADPTRGGSAKNNNIWAISGKIRISRGKFGFQGKNSVKFEVMGLRQWQYQVKCRIFQNHQGKLLYMPLCSKTELFGRIYTHGNFPFIVASIFPIGANCKKNYFTNLAECSNYRGVHFHRFQNVPQQNHMESKI